MNTYRAVALSALLTLTSLTTIADTNFPGDNTNNTKEDLAKYLKNLGLFLGYNLEQGPSKDKDISSTMINPSNMQLIQNYVFNTTLGSIPVTAVSTVMSNFVPSGYPAYAAINEFANYVFNSNNYSNAGGSRQGKVSVSPLIDQKTFQKDPVSQAVLNILGTPSNSFCMNYQGTKYKSDCKLLYQGKVINNTIGTLPHPKEFFSYDYNRPMLGQLNVNSLIAPKLYSFDDSSANSISSPSPPSGEKNKGLQAKGQAQSAANFVRYVIGAVTPGDLPSQRTYDDLYNTAMNFSGNTSKIDQLNAQTTLTSYLAKLRVYAAQTSVPISNIYHILSKRLPQKQSNDGKYKSSQEMSEFVLATWRLYNPDQPSDESSDSASNSQWINKINKASPATVQKEMAVLLAEINYQLYLSRQQQERLLLTNSVILLQLTKGSQPSGDFQDAPVPGDN